MGAQQKTQRVLGDGPMEANPEPESPSACDRLMEEVFERGNLRQALKRVKANKGAPGVDGRRFRHYRRTCVSIGRR
ncbi:MAG: hypothetical protein GAK28_04829 [Luteibacter sp.]|nr:MAG: hypothetical protein GAK28_04829 [Luteibacter sp.]